MRTQSIFRVAASTLIILSSQFLFANPLDARLYEYRGGIEFDNRNDYPNYVFLSREFADRYLNGIALRVDTVLTPCAIRKAIFDSLRVVTGFDTHRHVDQVVTFLQSDPRVLSSGTQIALTVAEGELYKRVHYTYHIERLDTFHFVIAPVKVRYHHRDGTIAEKFWRNGPLQPASPKDKRTSAIREPIYLVVLSSASLIIFAGIIRRRRKRLH